MLDGSAHWASGWGRIDTLQIAARAADDTVATWVLDDLDKAELAVQSHRLAALDATGTVWLDFAGLAVDDAAVLSVGPHDPVAARGPRLRVNGSLALGVARRSCALIGPSPLDDELAGLLARL